MRIAYVINSVEGGGAALPVAAVARVLIRHGADVRVFALTRRDGRAVKAMTDAGLTVDVCDGGDKDHLAALSWLDRRVTAWKADLLFTSLTRATLLGQVVGQRRRIPVVSWQHAAYLRPGNQLLLRLRQARSALWLADSHCVARLTAQRLGVPPERLATWPLFAADPQAPQARPWTPGTPVRVGALGRLHPVKGFDVLLEALGLMRSQGFCALAPFEVSIAGDGAERGRLQAMIEARGLENVRLVGFTDRPRDFLAGLHLYVQPSRSEGLCIAAHEAMQAGLPTIVSAVGELPFTTRDGDTGLVVTPGNPGVLAQALIWLLSRPERLAGMGGAARARVLDAFGAEAFARAGAEAFARFPVNPSSGPAAVRRRSTGRPASGLSAWRPPG
jgi:glycosyltransferase involved in cell wall biosynthesis